MINIPESWSELLRREIEDPYFEELMEFVESEYNSHEIFPPKESIFAALELTPPESVKVVIIGQDPYHDVGQAHGLCFSVAEGVKIPPSLVNIYKELESDLAVKPHTSGDLTRWAKQGVLMLNSVLTVRAHSAASHVNKGWERLTSAIVNGIAHRNKGVVYMLWGNYAQKKCTMIDPDENAILRSVHPSPLSAYRGFFGCKHFSSANNYLLSKGKTPIIW